LAFRFIKNQNIQKWLFINKAASLTQFYIKEANLVVCCNGIFNNSTEKSIICDFIHTNTSF